MSSHFVFIVVTMAEKKSRSLIGAISVGLVFVLAQIWMLSQASILFPQDTEKWKWIIMTYMVITAFVFSWGTYKGATLFKVNFLKRIHVFIIGAIVTFLLLYAMGFAVGSGQLPTIWGTLTLIPIGVLLLHALIVAVDEELIFRGFLLNTLQKNRVDRMTAYLTSAVIFAMFHFAMAGGEWLLLLIYIPLGLLFAFVKDKFSPQTGMANMGVHFGWNAFILGFGNLL